MVRELLNGSFQNTAFCLLAPDGKERLSRSGRSPLQSFGRRRRGRGVASEQLTDVTVAEMEKVAKNYQPQGDPATPIVQDFHSFRQALNVASGDQRLLLFVVAPPGDQEKIANTLSPVMGDPEIIGRFHVDLIGEKGDEKWIESVREAEPDFGPSIYVIQSDKFGQQGTVLKQLPANAAPEQIKSALLSANKLFASHEQRKDYSQHVVEGRRKRVYFNSGVEYGEDRDGDGKIDVRHRGSNQNH